MVYVGSPRWPRYRIVVQMVRSLAVTGAGVEGLCFHRAEAAGAQMGLWPCVFGDLLPWHGVESSSCVLPAIKCISPLAPLPFCQECAESRATSDFIVCPLVPEVRVLSVILGCPAVWLPNVRLDFEVCH